MATLEFWKLSALSDDQLLQDLSGLVTTGARLEARVVAHLAEVEERRLHLKAAHVVSVRLLPAANGLE